MVLVSTIHQHESVIGIHISPLEPSFHLQMETGMTQRDWLDEDQRKEAPRTLGKLA